MNPQVDSTSGLGLPQPGNDTSQLPPIHAPQTFHAPDGAIPQFGVSASPLPAAPGSPIAQPISMTPPVAVAPSQSSTAVQPPVTPAYDPLATVTAQFAPADIAATQADDADTPFDEEWVTKAKEVVDRTHTDPFLQSRELSKLKAQYIKARYNKDIKVSEE